MDFIFKKLKQIFLINIFLPVSEAESEEQPEEVLTSHQPGCNELGIDVTTWEGTPSSPMFMLFLYLFGIIKATSKVDERCLRRHSAALLFLLFLCRKYVSLWLLKKKFIFILFFSSSNKLAYKFKKWSNKIIGSISS